MPEQSGGGLLGGLKILTFVASTMARWVTAPLRFLVNDRHLAAAFRQGVHELGNTFGQMLPDSNTTREVGNIWSPTQGEIAGSRPIRPSEIARSNRPYDPGLSKGKEHGLEP
jgi:hypothetical protein